MTREFITNDIDGTPIHEGDRVWGFEQRYKTTLLEASDPPVYEEHLDSPLPHRDVPLFKGTTYWSEDMLAWWIKLEWLSPDWLTRPCCLAMGGGSYAYQKEP